MICHAWNIHLVACISKNSSFVNFPRFGPSTRVQMNLTPVRAPSSPTQFLSLFIFTWPYSEKRVLVRNLEIAEPSGHSLGSSYFPKMLGADVLQRAATQNDVNICRLPHKIDRLMWILLDRDTFVLEHQHRFSETNSNSHSNTNTTPHHTTPHPTFADTAFLNKWIFLLNE